MNRMMPSEISSEAVGYPAELELRWQDERAQRQRASQLFHGADWPDELDDLDELVDV